MNDYVDESLINRPPLSEENVSNLSETEFKSFSIDIDIDQWHHDQKLRLQEVDSITYRHKRSYWRLKEMNQGIQTCIVTEQTVKLTFDDNICDQTNLQSK